TRVILLEPLVLIAVSCKYPVLALIVELVTRTKFTNYNVADLLARALAINDPSLLLLDRDTRKQQGNRRLDVPCTGRGSGLSAGPLEIRYDVADVRARPYFFRARFDPCSLADFRIQITRNTIEFNRKRRSIEQPVGSKCVF